MKSLLLWPHIHWSSFAWGGDDYYILIYLTMKINVGGDDFLLSNRSDHLISYNVTVSFLGFGIQIGWSRGSWRCVCVWGWGQLWQVRMLLQNSWLFTAGGFFSPEYADRPCQGCCTDSPSCPSPSPQTEKICFQIVKKWGHFKINQMSCTHFKSTRCPTQFNIN